MSHHTYDDRPERELGRILNPSAPLTEEALDVFVEEASLALVEALTQLEAERKQIPVSNHPNTGEGHCASPRNIF